VKAIFVVFVLAVSVASAQTSCQHNRTAESLMVYCTMPDGSGVETDFIGDSVSDTTYNANEWRARLATIEKADADYLTELEKIRLDFHRKSWALSIHDKRTCKAQGFKWHRAVPQGWCTATTD
jgi:hypothetical protein